MSYSFDFEEYYQHRIGERLETAKAIASDAMRAMRGYFTYGEVTIQKHDDGKVDVVQTITFHPPNPIRRISFRLMVDDTLPRTHLENAARGFPMRGYPLDLRGLR